MEKLDQRLSSMLLEGIPTGSFQGLHCENTPERGMKDTVQLPFRDTLAIDGTDLKLFADAITRCCCCMRC